MKPRRVLAFVAVLAGYAFMLEIQFACGGLGGPAAVFSVRWFPDPPFREFLAGALGVLQPSYPTRDLIVAYRYLSGNPLNRQEQAAIQSSLQQHIAGGPDPARPAKAAAEQWRLAKIRVGFSGGVRVNVYKRSGDYSHYLNCPAHAFLTAIDTLQARAEYHGPESDDLRDWVRAQDQVFSNCSGGAKIPGSSRPAIDPLLYADRSYQIAAAHFYSGDFDEAYARFMEIGGDSESPWRVWGHYLAGRALIRKATVPFDSRGYDSQALDQAEAELRAVVDDPALAPTHGPARQLLTLIAFKKPSNEWGAGERALMNEQLRRRSISLQETEAGDDFVQLADTYRGMLTRLHRIEPAELDEMSRWILAFSGRLDFSAAFQRWQTTREVPWLVAALKGLRPSHGERPLLLRHAKEIPAASPAYPSVAYHAARVLMAAGNTAEARQWLTRVLENKSQRLPLSSTNQLLGLRMATARSLDELLADAPRKVLAMASIDGSARELLASQNWKSLVIHFTLVGGRVLGSNVWVGQCLTENQLFDESVEDLAYVAGLSTVEAKGEFVEVALEMHFTHLPLVSRSQPALQQRGNQVNMREFLGCQPRVSRRVGDPVAVAGFLQAPVTPPAVGMDQTAWLHTVAHKTHQTRARCVGDMAQTDPPHSAAFQFHRNHNQGFAHKLSPANVLLLAAQVSLVDLDTSAQPFPSQPNHRLPQLRQHQPGRLIAAQTEFTLQTLSAQPCFLGAGQPHCQKPTPQRHPRVVQDGSRSGRGLASAGATEHRASPRRPTLRGRAVRTNESRGPADADQILATGLLAGKPFSELHQMLWKVLAQLPRSSPPTARVQG